jgi:hypothetical protein
MIMAIPKASDGAQVEANRHAEALECTEEGSGPLDADFPTPTTPKTRLARL